MSNTAFGLDYAIVGNLLQLFSFPSADWLLTVWQKLQFQRRKDALSAAVLSPVAEEGGCCSRRILYLCDRSFMVIGHPWSRDGDYSRTMNASTISARTPSAQRVGTHRYSQRVGTLIVTPNQQTDRHTVDWLTD